MQESSVQELPKMLDLEEVQELQEVLTMNLSLVSTIKSTGTPTPSFAIK